MRMDLHQIKSLLEDTFAKELNDGKKRHIIFWYDDEGEFEEDLNGLNLSNAKLLRLNDKNTFYTKYLLEKVDAETNYLIYAPYTKPALRENYLLDIQKYSIEFSTDRADLIMRDLGTTDQNLRNIFRKHIKFFNNKDRYKSFKEYSIDKYKEEIIDIAVISVLCKLSYPDFDECLRIILMEEDFANNRFIEAIEKFGDLAAFWKLVDKYYGYSESEPSLEKLAITLMITNASYNLDVTVPNTWKPYISPRKTDCVVFLSNFMNHNLYAPVYDRLADTVEDKIKATEYVGNWETEDYIKCDTFKIFDESIISKINDKLNNDISEFEKYKEIIQSRKTKHWYDNFRYEYECLYWAIELLSEWTNVSQRVKKDVPYEFVDKYVNEYYQIDTAYRKFYYSFDNLKNREILHDLKDKVENIYSNAYLNTLSIKWSESLDTLNEEWVITGMNSQKDFYTTHIKPYMNRGERVFVIISDALRYEAAREFIDVLNKERKGSTEISHMQGVIPSYTKLGMASLLPYKSITMNNNYDVYIDGISTEGTDNRGKILSTYCANSIAVQYKDIIDLKRDDYRKTFTGKELIYIYHNTIDATGDNAKTEREVFNAVEEAFEELRVLISNLVNNITATNIVITSDHGFIYKRGIIMESDKVSKVSVDDSYENRRFILSTKPEHMEGTIAFKMDYLFGKDSDITYISPRGANRFKVQGAGANYVHGGTSLQEVIIPVVKYKNDRSKSAKNEIKKTDVKLTSITRKITNTISFLEFFQTEKIEDKRVSRRLKVYFADEEANRVSNENIIIADSKSENYQDRSFREKFVLKNTKYDKNKKYYLILEDEEETVEKVYEKIPFIIDIAISDDFGF
jgi:uncharacterized protein (TIGR02687 family)